MWKPNASTKDWEAPVGVAPWRDLTDDEFASLNADGGLERYFDHVDSDRKKGRTSAGEVT